jgi:hypothetical protein
MKNYLMLFRGGLDFTSAPPEQVQQVILKWKSWVEDLTKKGIYSGGERVTRNGAAVVSGKAKQVTSGPYAGGGEILGGFISVQANDLQQALELAKDCPIFDFDGIVEIREVAPV